MAGDVKLQVLVQAIKEHAVFLGKKIDTLPKERTDLAETNRLLQEIIDESANSVEVTLEIS